MKTIIILALFALFQSTPHIPVKDLSSDEASIDSLLTAYYQTMTDRNWKTYRNFFWDNATLTTIWQQPGESKEAVHVSTIDSFIAQTHLGPDSQPIFEEKLISSEVTVKNNLAQAWVRYEAKFGAEENLMTWSGTDLFSFIKHNDEWRIVSLVFSQDQ